VKVNLADMNTSGWKDDLKSDLEIASFILKEMKRVTPEHDEKLQDLKRFIKEKVEPLASKVYLYIKAGNGENDHKESDKWGEA